MQALRQPHAFRGKLIIVEGIDGSGKSTQLLLAMRDLQAKGLKPFFTEWNSADLVKTVTKKGKKKMSLTPMTFSLLHATDFAHRLVHNILPPLKAGMIVLADRYAYTAFARDATRGVDGRWLRRWGRRLLCIEGRCCPGEQWPHHQEEEPAHPRQTDGGAPGGTPPKLRQAWLPEPVRARKASLSPSGATSTSISSPRPSSPSRIRSLSGSSM